jgi:hypothetical protein
MSEFGSYAFLPWLRQGVARAITSADGDATVLLRASAHVELSLTGLGLDGSALQAQVARDVELYGPGEVIGIENRAIIRTDPRPWITNFEPNYLAQIEFCEEDFPWRYTPAAPDVSKLKLRPWITLVVLKDTGDLATTEFQDAKAVAGRPLPFIAAKDFATFPPANELWAWAHVHVNRGLGATPDELAAADVPAAVGRLETALAANPDIAYSRIVCPRRLEENCAYHAFLVPTFERGRLAGLGLDPGVAPFASASAWADYGGRPEPQNVPYYHRWYFRTGGAGDFETLVRLLKWKTADPRVGRRDMDVQEPGSNIPGILEPDLHGILRLGGALRAPLITLSPDGLEEFNKYENWAKAAYPHPFQQKLARFINLADEFIVKASEDARNDAGLPPIDPDDVDPLITSPIYGEWQALQHRLLMDGNGAPLLNNANWIHELNLDPRHRVAGGFGGDVVRKCQEDFMEAAWLQVGDVLAHNQKVRVAKTWVALSDVLHAKTIAALAPTPTRLLSFTAPLQARVLTDGVTLRYARQQSVTPTALTSPMMRRIARPGGPLARKLALADGRHATTMLEAVNTGEITAAPPKQTPTGITTVEDVAHASAGSRAWPPDWMVDLVRQAPWLPVGLLIAALVPLVLAFLLGGLGLLLGLSALVALGAGAAFQIASRQPSLDEALGPALDKPESIDHLGAGPNFVFGDAEEPGAPTGVGGVIGGLFAQDNPAAQRFKIALKDWGRFAEAADIAGRETPRTEMDLARVSATVVTALNPETTIPRRFLASAKIAAHIRAQVAEVFDEIKYYPRIDLPMYRPLKELGEECFVPNLNLIERDSVVALEAKQDFIESYMVGVNHEFSRELLWREYPTDQRGTYFRQFWDVASHYDPTQPGADDLREKLYDIPPIHMWPHASELGEHDNRQANPGEERNEIVLAIRGELLKKYPTTVVYAHAAEWAMKDGHIDPSKERQLVELTPAELAAPPHSKVRTPLYEAKVDPDIYFFGFDLDAEEARGGTGDHDTDPPGWFFVLKERPGEPRFGLDDARGAGEPVVAVNDLAWSDAGTAPGGHLNAGALVPISLTAPSAGRDDLEKQPQYDDDKRVVGAPTSAARWAYLLYQAPVMVAVHSAELLKAATD